MSRVAVAERWLETVREELCVKHSDCWLWTLLRLLSTGVFRGHLRILRSRSSSLYKGKNSVARQVAHRSQRLRDSEAEPQERPSATPQNPRLGGNLRKALLGPWLRNAIFPSTYKPLQQVWAEETAGARPNNASLTCTWAAGQAEVGRQGGPSSKLKRLCESLLPGSPSQEGAPSHLRWGPRTQKPA